MSDEGLPAWSEPFIGERRSGLGRQRPLGELDRAELFDGADGSGVRVAIIDSGVEPDHPAVGGRLISSMVVEPPENDDDDPIIRPDEERIDVVGHGTACAGIIHGLAPAAELISIRVLGRDNRGKGYIFAAGLQWAIEQGAMVVNLSLSSRSEAMFPIFHELADQAYFANCLLVSAANNVPGASYPSLFAAVVSVASHDIADPWTWFYNPDPPVEFGAYGVDVEVAWKGGGTVVATGNSFAAPHVTGLAALIRSRRPDATPFEVKTILAAMANRPG